MDRHTDALADFDSAIRIDPNDAQAYCNRGVMYAALGQHTAALADYAVALRLRS